MANHVPWNAVINLGNSIIGVSILAMPWCFKECGVVLGIALLLCGGFLTKATCYLLLRASKVSRKHSYEFLAQHALGAAGKMTVEFCIIGLLMCTCVAFFVIIGDLAPSIVSKWLGLQNSWHLRCCLLILVAVFIVLPLGMKRNVESLGSLSMMSICFYLLFTADILWNSLPSLLSLKWMDTLELWRLPGVLKGISIFSMSLCCQTTLFVVYDSLQEKTVKQMEAVVSKSVNMVTGIYTLVGFFGYVCYYQTGIKGDILVSFAPSLLSEILRLGFTVSVALSFPLCIFPCRASIYTLFCHSTHSVENPHGGGDFIPPAHFKLITLMIISATLMVGITIPHVETILGLTGATMGSMIGFIIPAIIYLCTTGVPNKNNAKIILVIGVLLLVCSTYDNLRTINEPELDINIDENIKILNEVPVVPDIKPVDPDVAVKVNAGDDVIKNGDNAANQKPDEKEEDGKRDDLVKAGDDAKPDDIKKDVEAGHDKRQEPPIPHAPDSKEDARGDRKLIVVEIPDKKEQVKEKPDKDFQKDIKDDAKEGGKANAGDDDDDIGAADFEAGNMKDGVKKEAKENEKKQKELEEKEQELKNKEENLDKIVEDKFAEQDQKQEVQMKKLEELEERQHEQEKVIEAQAEVIENLKVQHEQEPHLDLMDQFDVGGDLLIGGQMDGGQQQVDVNMQQVPGVQVGLQQQQQHQQQQHVANIQQQGIPQVPMAQQQDMAGLQPVIPQGVAGQPMLQQGVAGQPMLQQGVAGQPVLQQGVAGQPMLHQGVAGQPVLQQGVAGQPVLQQGGAAQPVLQQGGAAQPVMVVQPGIQQGVAGRPGIQQGVVGQPGIQLQPIQGGVAPQVGLAPQGGIAPQGIVPQQGAVQPIEVGEQVVEGHIVRREAPFNPQLQQQNVDMGQHQLQQQQLPVQQQQQFQQPGQFQIHPQLSNKLPQQQQQVNMPNQQLNIAGKQPLQPNVPAQQLQQLNMPGQQVADDTIMMHGAVAQQRQLLQGNSQEVPPLPVELQKDNGAHDGKPEAFHEGKELDIGKQDKEQVDEILEKIQAQENNGEPGDNQMQVNNNLQVPEEQVENKRDDEVQEEQEENKGEQVQQKKGEDVPIAEQVQEINGDPKAQVEDQELGKQNDKAPPPNVEGEVEKSKSQDAEVKDDTKETAREKDAKEDRDDVKKRHGDDVNRENDNGDNKQDTEVNVHEVKFKTRQEMAVQSTESIASLSDKKSNHTASNVEAIGNGKTTGVLTHKQTTYSKENSKELIKLGTGETKTNKAYSDDSFKRLEQKFKKLKLFHRKH